MQSLVDRPEGPACAECQARMDSPAWESIAELESALSKSEKVETPLRHRFTPGLYIREIFVPKGTLCTSKIHMTEHPFAIMKGDISVWTEETGTVRLKAPYTGITLPATRRVLFAHEDTVWITFHPTTETDLSKIEQALIFPHRISTKLETP